jgi:hypothetical protein
LRVTPAMTEGILSCWVRLGIHDFLDCGSRPQ